MSSGTGLRTPDPITNIKIRFDKILDMFPW